MWRILFWAGHGASSNCGWKPAYTPTKNTDDTIERLIPIPFVVDSDICPHNRRVRMKSFEWSKSIFKIPHWSEEDKYPRLLCQAARGCPSCLTEVRLDLKRSGNKGSAIFVTSWKDLGTGHSIRDPKYLSNVYSNPYMRYRVDYKSPVWKKFEWKGKGRGPNFKFDQLLTSENEEKLFRRNLFGEGDNIRFKRPRT